MYSRLIAYGDSWTAGHGVETNTEYKEVVSPNKFIDRLRISNSWPRWLSDKLEIPFVNMGVPGYWNNAIAHDVEESKEEIQSDDLVIIMLSFPYRRINKSNLSDSMDAIFNPIKRMQESLKDTGATYYIVNSFYPTFQDFPHRGKQIVDLSTFLDVDGCAGHYLIEYEQEHGVSVWEYNSRSVHDEKSYRWGDYHPNLLGYKLIAEYLYKHLTSAQQML